ncbi:hypothetical protein BGZ94_004830 [Podila epigama]|nr:hypothetical protein BGZ94_004830 [Podila epigama]
MQYKAPSPLMRFVTLVGAFVLLLVFAPSGTQANTEKVVFTVRHAKSRSSDSSSEATGSSIKEGTLSLEQDPLINDPSQWKHMSSPHTILRNETIRPSFYADDVTIQHRLETQKDDPLVQEAIDKGGRNALESREYKWYVLDGLSEGMSFELRISYPATNPADFEMRVWTLNEAQAHVPLSIRLDEHFSKDTMFARIKATYTGVSYKAGAESKAVPYNVVLERLYLQIPYQALKLAVAIGVVVAGGLGYVVPRLYGHLSDVAGGKVDRMD